MIKAGDNAWIGWVDLQEQSEIEGLAILAPDFFSQFPHALVTCIDSNWAPGLSVGIRKEIEACGIRVEVYGDGLLTTGESVRILADKAHFFNGFDQVWFFSGEPREPCPLRLNWGTGDALEPGWELSQGVLDAVAWMARSGARLGLGDGFCLNYLTTDLELAEELERLP